MAGIQERPEYSVQAEDVKRSSPSLHVSRSASSNRLSYDGEGDVIPLYRGKEFLLYFDYIFRFWIYFDTLPHAVAYLSAFGFWIGGMLFVIGTFSSVSPAVYNDYSTDPTGDCVGPYIHDTYVWWTAFTYLLGDIIWLIACYCQMMEAMNRDYEEKLIAWEDNKMEGRKPRYNFVGVHYWSLEWWGAFSYWFGVAMYLTAEICIYVNFCPGPNLSETASTWLTAYLFTIAGILFFLAGIFYIIVLGSKWVIPNIFIPFNYESLTSMMWWSLFTYFWGGVGFFMSGIFLYWYSAKAFTDGYNISLKTYNWQNGFGFGGGAFLFLVGSMLLLMRQSRGRCRPSMMPLQTNMDPTVYGGKRYAEVRKTDNNV